MFQHIGPSAKRRSFTVINVSVEKGVVPLRWTEAIMVSILKHGKNILDTASYRPISFLSYIGKLIESL